MQALAAEFSGCRRKTPPPRKSLSAVISGAMIQTAVHCGELTRSKSLRNIGKWNSGCKVQSFQISKKIVNILKSIFHRR
jgi:hypothetical protein